ARDERARARVRRRAGAVGGGQAVPAVTAVNKILIHVTCTIANPVDRRRSSVVDRLLVDTGSECTWIPARTLEKLGIRREKKDVAFVMANGQQITRQVGFAILHVVDHFTVDEVVFAEPGDLLLLGARTLEGLNLTIDAARHRLLGAGPHPAASPVRRKR